MSSAAVVIAALRVNDQNKSKFIMQIILYWYVQLYVLSDCHFGKFCIGANDYSVALNQLALV